MSDETNLMIIGAYIWGAIYVGAVIVAGLVWGSHMAVVLAVASAGAAYLCQMLGAFGQIAASSKLASASGLCMVASILAGLGAALMLIAGV